jgi:hypothetical protein
MGTVHILHPTGDKDKCVCGVRLSQGAQRSSATKPSELTCEKCFFRCLRSWQEIDPDINPVPSSWSSWPWEHPNFKYQEE